MIRASFFLYIIWSLSTGFCVETQIAQLIHISLGGDVTSMVVVWSTQNDTLCFVQYDTSDDFRFIARENVSKLTQDHEKALSYLHRAELKDLMVNQTYLYKVVCEWENEVFPSDVFRFKTLSDRKEQQVHLLVYGDLGAKCGKSTVSALGDEVLSGKYHAIFHNGDFGYDMHSDQGAVGDKFLQMIQPIAAQIPYMTSPGNHEISGDFHHYRHRFSMPGTDWPMPYTKLWYSFDIGPIHFISYSTEMYFIHNQDDTCGQYYWLLEDLKTANENRNTTPWIIAMGHRPMYCSNSNLDDCTPHFWGQWVKRGLEDLFYGMGVDLVIEAHEHSYERLWPVYKSDVLQHSYVNPRAPVHVISGAGGNGEGVDWMGRPSAWSAFRADKRSKHSYGRLSIMNRTHLYFDQVNSVTKEVLDKFWMVKETHGPFISNIDCDRDTYKHKLCTCPPPLHYVTIAICIGVALIIVICASILFCCYSFKCCWSCFCCCCCYFRYSCCCRMPAHRRQYDHHILINTDIEELMLAQPTETINYFDTDFLL